MFFSQRFEKKETAVKSDGICEKSPIFNVRICQISEKSEKMKKKLDRSEKMGYNSRV